ncbi:MAG: acyltransferase family protein [Cryobacterium sp.]|uniref:acyltransferase family protein n=1 Tax=unclassified Cryobacterium TaxID=2649013 RepID=UPI0018CAB8C6|nr:MULTISPECIES: acyltransferase family protein [unclassified Cryobacterium]MCY7404845.1 acyltransferase family protein [Cryobacterium sp.]MEC5154832.1 putative membrane protein YcfT [Cryobacterium sp. CAN_C3]
MTGVPAIVPGRDAWIDVAKGIAITLVVLYHSIMYLDEVGLAGALAPLNPLFDTFRMPLFFFMSGILAASAIRLPYWQLFRKRMSLLLYLYGAWVTMQTLFLLALPPISPSGTPNATWASLVTLFLRPSSNLWFIYALPLFFTLSWLMRRWPPLLQVALTMVIAVLFGAQLLHTGSPWDKMGKYLVFFIAAIYVGPLVRRLVPSVRWWHVAMLCLGYAALVVITTKLTLTRVPFVLLVLSTLAVIVGITVAVLLARMPAFDFVRSLGSRTLPIYLLHTFPMTALAAILVAFDVRVPAMIATALPPLLCAGAIVVALALHRRFHAVPGVFTVPVASWVITPQRAVISTSPPG